MQYEIEVPDLGASARIEVRSVLVRPGDRIARDQPVLVLHSTGNELPVVAPADGTIRAVLVRPGDAVSSFQVVMHLEADGPMT